MEPAERLKDIEVAPGDGFDVELEGRPGGGAMWQAPAVSGGPVLEGQRSVGGADGIGGGVRQRFHFRAPPGGTHELRFELRRSWEPDAKRVVLVTVRVR